MITYVILKDPKPFAPDRVFEVPITNSGYVNMNFKYACQWYRQVFPKEVESDNEQRYVSGCDGRSRARFTT